MADEALRREPRAGVREHLKVLVEMHRNLKQLGVTLHAPAPHPNDLPRDAHAFTGREDELAGAVENGGVVAVGKTAFAVHAAHVLADRFPDGQIFLDLPGHTAGQAPLGPHDALASLLAAMGVESQRLPADIGARVALWRRKLRHKRMVVARQRGRPRPGGSATTR